ncbi:hypothetical protein J4573_04490 [Actinomadura barringtoniae]|uniref:Uncharacterized protein n=1 Tax=Actinomadura barringtoniae TaxID=1427535 RepID=A0A939P6E6_9ACTN|nr:hypothetical protein [Actinomadura barringtoniae]MBO2446336.1 hypothetical protein [Actinomadura barringtoniae]
MLTKNQPRPLTARQRTTLERGKRTLLTTVRTNPDCTAVAYGFRRRGGAVTGEPVVIVSVARKLPRDQVPAGRLVPGTVTVGGEQHGVDVIQAARFELSGSAAASASAKAAAVDPIGDVIRPVRPGCMITNNPTTAAGTAGCVVIDKTDGTLCLLTAGIALGSRTGAGPGGQVLQPNGQNFIGKIKRITTLRTDRVNTVDAALVELPGQIGATELIALDLMAPLTPAHKIVGLHLYTASDGSALYMRIERVLQEMNVQLLNCPNTDVIGQSTFGANVEKVGAASRYTSSVIVGMGATPVQIGDTYYNFDDLVQVDNGFVLAGDQGAAVLLGGNGNVRVPSDG